MIARARRAALLNHPDKLTDRRWAAVDAASERFRACAEAHEVPRRASRARYRWRFEAVGTALGAAHGFAVVHAYDEASDMHHVLLPGACALTAVRLAPPSL